MKRLLFLIVLSLVAALIMALSVGAQQGGGDVTTSMEDNYFDQANVTVPAGTTVTWVQNGNNPHTTTSYDGLWDSGLIQGGTGGTYSFTFDEPGTHSYFCGPHEDPGMIGTVTVAGGTGASSGQQQELAATGGPSLLWPAAVLLMASGLVGLAVRRRIYRTSRGGSLRLLHT